MQKKQTDSLGILRALTLLAALAGSGAAYAQADVPASAPASRSACLVKPKELPKYPEREKQLRVGGIVRAKLTFYNPDRAPRVEILSWSGSEYLVEAAESYLLGYRLPCLPYGDQLVLEQEVAFNAIEGGRQEELVSNPWDCLRTPGPFSLYEDRQTGTLVRQPMRGNMLLLMTFDAPDAPPKVQELYNSGPSQFRLEVLDHVAKYRLPCLKQPVTTMQSFQYNGTARGKDYSLRDMGIVAFLGAIKDPDKMSASFDLDSMSCPFKLRWSLYQPAHFNQVTELGPRVAARKPLLDWLSKVTLRLSKEQFESLLGAQMVITVPCGKIDI